jgi:hypothetical protein
MADFEAFLAAAHERGMKVLLDIPFNHTSVEHPWFVESKDPLSDKRDWYHWADESTAGIDLKQSVWGANVWRASEGGWKMAFNGAADRIEKQLRRYTNRLKDHKVDESAQPYTENAAYTIFSGTNQADEEAGDAPAIVAETRVDIPESSVADAVMLMDLRNTTALMFKNSATGQLNMIYRREDGNIGWVEPHDD